MTFLGYETIEPQDVFFNILNCKFTLVVVISQNQCY